MKFCKISDASMAAKVIARRLCDELESGKQVLWLLSGGSNIYIEVAAMKLITPDRQTKLTIMFSDERFGRIGHQDSNMQKLLEAGFAAGRATIVPTLTPSTRTLESTAEHFQSTVTTAFDKSDAIITQLGIGPDGHTAGILPHSPAVASKDLVAWYHADDFERVTLSFVALKKSTAIYAFTFGADRREQLERLRDQELPLAEQPAQILKQVSEAYVYNDQIGG